VTKGKGQRSKGKGQEQGRASAERPAPASIDELYQLPLSEFTPARNALAGRLRKSGKAGDADEVRSLVKPSIPAWAVNQVYWKHRPAFDRLLSSGDRLRKAQSSTLAGKAADVRGALDSVRQSLSELSRLAASELETAGHNASAGAMRAVTATLEALSAYGDGPNAPRAGRLVDEVDPPGFETLAALVPNASGSVSSDLPSRVLQFQPPAPKPTKRGTAEAAVDEADKQLREARSTAQDAQSALKKAAATAKDTEQAMIEAEQVLDKVAKEAHAARQLARRLAAEAETAAQALEDAERALARATKAAEDI
jgi:hypothetical protein